MRQFKINYLIYTLLILAASIYIGVESFSDSYIDDAYNEFKEDSENKNVSENELKKTIKFSTLMMAILLFVFFIISVSNFNK